MSFRSSDDSAIRALRALSREAAAHAGLEVGVGRFERGNAHGTVEDGVTGDCG